MRLDGTTHRQTINLSREAHTRLLACVNGVGMASFVEVALRAAAQLSLPAPPEFKVERAIYPRLLAHRAESPSVLGARLESVLLRLRPTVRSPAPREELIFDLPSDAVLLHTEWAVREGLFPHEALGDTIETALATIERNFSTVEARVESIAAPVNPYLLHRVNNHLKALGLDPDAVLAAEFMAAVRGRSL